MGFRRSKFRASFFLAAFLLVVARLGAQNPMGALRGSVLDSSGAAIPHATIRIVNVAQSVTARTIETDDRGEFVLASLEPALYEVTVHADGFEEQRLRVQVAVSSAREIRATLRPAPQQQTVTLDGVPPAAIDLLQTDSAVHLAVIAREDLATVPLAART